MKPEAIKKEHQCNRRGILSTSCFQHQDARQGEREADNDDAPYALARTLPTKVHYLASKDLTEKKGKTAPRHALISLFHEVLQGEGMHVETQRTCSSIRNAITVGVTLPKLLACMLKTITLEL